MTINERLRELRLSTGLTQKQFAKKIGTSQAAVNYWENNKRQPKLEQIKKIADAFNTTMARVVGVDEKQNDFLMQTLEEYPGTQIETHKNPPNTTTYSKNESALVNDFRLLNKNGKKEARKRIQELTELPRYTKPDESPKE